ncbi:FliG C-terminal domain-containing protein [Henriciella aquimarina]|uniref:FliG C-terminal domain-containing protein n=1 Tax=Henriciella aquimarina TaxID=545261 RepID=UPI001301E595|nr:FliG C-terminal domain-containing protein [Henriciella aquimarina]
MSTASNTAQGQAQARGAGNAQQRPSVSITPAQRAAVVIAMLGENAARPIVDKLDDQALGQVARALETISYLEREQLTEIVVDFLKHLRQSSGAFRGGRTRAREIITGLLDDSRLRLIYDEGAGSDENAPARDDTWGRLERQEPHKVAGYLNRLSPNLIALVLRKLDVSVASEIVSELDDSKLDPMIGHLVEADHSDLEVDGVVARMIEMEFLNSQDDAAEDDEAHLETIGELLSLIPSDKRDRLIAFLKSEHQGKMDSIERVIFTIEGLADMLPRNSVPVVFRELGEDTMIKLLASLSGPSASVQEYLLGNISSRLADQYREQLNDVKAPGPEAAETTQREFLTALMSLKRRGLITLEKPAAAA